MTLRPSWFFTPSPSIRPLRLAAAAGVTALAALAGEGEASAQVRGFGVSRFEPSERGSEWFVLESLDLRGHVRPAVGVVGEYQYRSLATYDANGDLLKEVVKHMLVLHPGASLVLWDRLRVAASVPLQLYTAGESAEIPGGTLPAPANAQAFGDPRLGADVRLLGAYGDAATLALGAQVAIPVGSERSYAGDGQLRVTPRATLAGDIGAFAYAAKLGFQYRARSEDVAGSPIGSELVLGVSAGARLADKKLLVGPELYGSTVTDGGDAFRTRTTPLQALLGAHYTAGDIRFGAGVGTGITRGYGTPLVHVLANVEWVPSFAKDDAPPRAEDDRDKDGIADALDACPDDAGKRYKDPKANGCPDRDKDGVVDPLDACPDEPGVASKDAAKNGCPVERDRDKDGVLDEVDACPDTPGLKTSDPRTNGCPDEDRDKDGIKNADDACPDEPGPANTDRAKNGCPKAFVKDGQIVILEQVRFKTSSAEILPGKDSLEVLEAVLGVLRSHPEIAHLRVEGHTDSRGNAAFNKKLSADRAASVVKWLVARGIEKARLASAGFGPDRPIDSNDTDAGRQKNRRVEFHIDK